MASKSAREIGELMNTKTVLGPGNMEVHGDDQQILTISLRCDDEILVEPGCMVWCDSGIVNDISAGGFKNFMTRMCCMDESGFRVHWKNRSDHVQRISLTPSFPAKVVPVNLDVHSGELFLKAGSFIAATDAHLSFDIERAGRGQQSTLGTGFFGGQGFVLNKVKGEGWVFLGAAGAIMEKELGSGETITVDRSCVVAWETTVQFSWRTAGSASMMCCGGEGLTMSTLTGPGYVIIQSMPFEKVRQMVTSSNTGNASGGRSPLKRFVFLIILCLYMLFWVMAKAKSTDKDKEIE